MAYFTLFHVVGLAKVFGWLHGSVAHVIDPATIIPASLGSIYLLGRSRRHSALDMAVFVYLLFSLGSVLAYLLPGNPCQIKAYLYGVHLFVLPVSLFFAAKSLDLSQQRRLLRYLCVLSMLAMSLGVYWHMIQPGYYLQFLAGEAYSTMDYSQDWQLFHRLGSYFGSTSMGSIAAITICLCVLAEFRSVTMTRLIMATMFVGVLLTHQRGGFLASAVALAYVVVSGPTNHRMRQQVFAVAMCAAFVIGGAIAVEHFREGTLEQLFPRYTKELKEGIANVTKDRGYGPGMAYAVDFPLGVGLGATCSAVDRAGLTQRGQVVDANFMRILADLGIQGLASFLFVLFLASYAALRKRRSKGWIVLIASVCMICLVTNTLDQVYVPHLFWFVLGCIDTPEPKLVEPSRRVELRRGIRVSSDAEELNVSQIG